MSTSNSKSVLIIGAGAAGLAAAGKLAAADVKVTILEARDRIGGRIHTLRTDWPRPIEAGPEFIHGDAPEMQQLLQSSDASLEELPDRHWHLVDGAPRQLDFDDAWGEVFDNLQKYSGPDLSFAEYLDRNGSKLSALQRQMAIDYAEGFNAADARLLSVHWLQKVETELSTDEPIRRLASGYDQIAAALLGDPSRVEIQLNSRVSKIDWKPGRVEVTFAASGNADDSNEANSSTRTIIANAAIVTLPLSVLQTSPAAGGVEFVPDLPNKRHAASQMRMGAVLKAALRFDKPIWLDRGVRGGFLHIPGARFMTWWPMGDSPMVTGWSGGTRAWELSQQSNDEIRSAAIADLARGLATDVRFIEAHLLDNIVFNWQRDPLSRGAYSYPAVGGANASLDLAAPVADTLFFAGEATEQGFAATVPGAIRSGYRAADEILKLPR